MTIEYEWAPEIIKLVDVTEHYNSDDHTRIDRIMRELSYEAMVENKKLVVWYPLERLRFVRKVENLHDVMDHSPELIYGSPSACVLYPAHGAVAVGENTIKVIKNRLGGKWSDLLLKLSVREMLFGKN